MSGVTTPNLPSMSVSDSVLVHRGGTTGQQAIDKLAQQLNADLNIADDRQGAEAARDKAQDWAEGAGEPGGPGTRSAKTWASEAEQSRMDAEIARDAAFGNADVHTDVPTGLAAVSDGAQFQVIEGDEIVRYRRDDASTAVEVARYPAAARVSSLVPLAPASYAFSITDEDGLAAFGIREDGGVDVASLNGADGDEIARVTSIAGALIDAAPAGYSWSILDEDGRAAIAVKGDGTFEARKAELQFLNDVPIGQIIVGGSGGTVARAPRHFPAEHNGVDSYGQSLSVGADATPPITGSQRFDNLMFDTGIIGSGASATSLVPLVEVNNETPIGGASDMIRERLLAEDQLTHTDHRFRMIGTASGAGGTAIAGLVKATGPYNRLIGNVQKGYDLSQAEGATYQFNAFFWTQGESDYINSTDAATYKNACKQLRADIEADVRAITGQTDPVLCIGYQVQGHATYGHSGNPYIAVAQLEATREEAHVHIACPLYWSAQSVHQSAANSKILGAYYGLAYKRLVINREDWMPLQPVSVLRQGNLIFLHMHVPVGELVLDTVSRAAQANFGFSVVDGGGVAISITSVEITGPNTIRIVTATEAVEGRVRYGYTSGGNIRDRQGEQIVFDGGGLDHPIHNWCVIFNEPLN